MRIQELEQQVGIERATIRYYEKEGLIDPKRSENGYRDYSENDAAELRRIRLLRDLGIGLDTIKKLQQGTVDMASVMASQSAVLRGRREQLARAQAVCEQISADGASYLGLDTVRYQNLLTQPPQAPQPGKTVFRDHVRQPHPWRRYFARMLDQTIVAAVVWLIVVMVLRWRPAGDILSAVMGYASWFILMPLEALCLSLWGTTPGKWVFGIRIEAAEGGHLRFSEALGRAWGVFYTGMGMNVPLVNFYCLYRAYKTHNETWDMDWDWDHECEVSFRDCNWKNTLLGIALFASAVGLNVVSELNALLPRYRSDEMTVAQFASNFNFYDEILMSNTEFMDRDGVLAEPGYTQTIVLPDGDEVEYDPNGQFTFETSGKIIDRITYHTSWYEYDMSWTPDGTVRDLDELARWLPVHCRVAALTAALSQKGMSQGDLAALLAQVKADLQTPTGDGQRFTYGAVTVSWKLDLEPYRTYEEGSAYPDIYYVTLDMTIEWA